MGDAVVTAMPTLGGGAEKNHLVVTVTVIIFGMKVSRGEAMHTHRQPMGHAVQPSGSVWGRGVFAMQKLTHTHTHRFTGVAGMVGAPAAAAARLAVWAEDVQQCGRL